MLNKLIKGYDNPQDAQTRIRVGRFSGFIGIFANLVLFAVKLVCGLLTGAISIIADSLNNLSDSGSNILTVVGYTVAGKPADKDHPYGHARMEYLCSLFVSAIIAFLGFEMLTTSIEKLVNKEQTEPFNPVLIIIMASTILVKIIIAIMNFKLGKHISSQALKASAVDAIGDVIATSAVVIGMLLTPYTGPYTDSVIGILIAIYIVVMGIKLVLESSDTLLGKAPENSFVHEISSKIKAYDGVLGIHDMVVHSYGEKKTFITAHVEVDADADVMVSHDLIDRIEADFLKEGINLVIHLDPISISDEETNTLRAKCQQIVNEMSNEYCSPISMHDFRIVKGITHTNIIFDICISNDLKTTNIELCDEITSKIKEISPLYNLVLTIDRDYFSERYEK